GVVDGEIDRGILAFLLLAVREVREEERREQESGRDRPSHEESPCVLGVACIVADGDGTASKFRSRPSATDARTADSSHVPRFASREVCLVEWIRRDRVLSMQTDRRCEQEGKKPGVVIGIQTYIDFRPQLTV